MPQFIAIGANQGLPKDWNDMAQEPQVLGDEARHEPVLLLGHPECATSQEQGACFLVRRGNFDCDQGAGTGGYGRAFDQELDGCMTHSAIVAEAMSDANKAVTVASGKALGAVLVG